MRIVSIYGMEVICLFMFVCVFVCFCVLLQLLLLEKTNRKVTIILYEPKERQINKVQRMRLKDTERKRMRGSERKRTRDGENGIERQ